MDDLRIATDEEMAEDAIATATEETRFTKVIVEVEGQRYELEFSRSVVKRMEAEGFDIGKVDTMPATMMEALVLNAFEMHHASLPKARRLWVWDQLSGKDGDDGLMNALVRLYMAPIRSLMADPTATTATWKLA